MLLSEVFTAGQPKRFNVVGNFFRVKSLSGLVANSLDVLFFKDGQPLNIDLTDVDAGDWARVPSGYDYVEITSSVAQTVGVQFARGDVGSDRVAGEVSVVDGDRALSINGQAFSVAGFVAAVAAQYSAIQLFMPALSGKRALVSFVEGSVNVANASMYLYEYNAALTALIGTAPNLSLGGAASSSEIRSQTSVAGFGTGTIMNAHFVSAADPLPLFDSRRPVVVGPGKGLLLMGSVVNADLRGSFVFCEEGV